MIDFQTTARPYQIEAVAAIERDLPTHAAVLVVLPTGTGKTFTFSEFIRRQVSQGKRVLVVAHRRELIQQAAGKLREFGLSVGIERGKTRSSGQPVIVASVQTLRGSRLWNLGDFDVIVLDEAHHSPSVSWQRVLEHYPLAHVVGVTATPDRLDRVGLCGTFKKVSYHMTLRRAIAEGWLAPIRARRIQVRGMDLSKVRSRCGDLRPDDLHNAVIPQAAVDGIAGPLFNMVEKRKTVVFAVDVGHSKALVEALNEIKPDCAASVDGTMSDIVRQETIKKFVDGEIQFLINAQLLVEGWDVPSIECVAMCRPTESRSWYTQAVGRGLRLAEGKNECLLLDFAGVGAKHSLVGPEDVLGLPKLEGLKKEKRTRKAKGSGLIQVPKTTWFVGSPTVTPFDPMHRFVQKVSKVGSWFKDFFLGG